jgi:ABC-type multidrug transport system fused ATPase/permease subunit
VNRWISVRFNMLSSAIISLTAVVMLRNHRVDAAAAGFALTFITSLTIDLLWLVRRFVALEQSMVAVERVKEFSELQQEPPEYVEPRPPASWPVSQPKVLLAGGALTHSFQTSGAIEVENLVIRYAVSLHPIVNARFIDHQQPDLPAVLHNLSFSIRPGEKIGILGRSVTGYLAVITCSSLNALG